MMGLVAVLSNMETGAVLQRLTGRDRRQVWRSPPRSRDRSRDGKLKFGTVSGAVLAVLAEAGGPLRYIEIHSRVERRLGLAVPKSSVKHLLHLEARRTRQRIERVGRGLYVLAKP
jgi:hypothetical protein